MLEAADCCAEASKLGSIVTIQKNDIVEIAQNNWLVQSIQVEENSEVEGSSKDCKLI